MTTSGSQHAAELDGGLTPVRSTPLFDPVNPVHEGDSTMPDSLQLSAVDHLAHDRIHDLYATATETRGDAHRGDDLAPGDAGDSAGKPGLMARTRGTLGRGLISIGSAVAGQPH